MENTMNTSVTPPLFVQEYEHADMTTMGPMMGYDGSFEYHNQRAYHHQRGIDCMTTMNHHSDNQGLRLDAAAAQTGLDMGCQPGNGNDTNDEAIVNYETTADDEIIAHYESIANDEAIADDETIPDDEMDMDDEHTGELSSDGSALVATPSNSSSATRGSAALHPLATAADIDPFPANFNGNKKDSLTSPENQFITQQRLRLRDWASIIDDLNDRAETAGKDKFYTEASVYGRFKRNGSRIAVMLGYPPFAERAYMHLYSTEDGGRARRHACSSSLDAASISSSLGAVPQRRQQNSENDYGVPVTTPGVGTQTEPEPAPSTRRAWPSECAGLEQVLMLGCTHVMRTDEFADAVADFISHLLGYRIPTEAVQGCLVDITI